MTFVSQMKGRAAEGTRWLLLSVGLLVLRVGAGGVMAYGHGWDKLREFGDRAAGFVDPLGLPLIGAKGSFALLTFAEFFCAIAVALGLLTRLAAIPLVIAMAVAAFLVHLPQVLEGKQTFRDIELALVYLVMFGTLVLTGGGKFSLDALLFRKKRKPT